MHISRYIYICTYTFIYRESIKITVYLYNWRIILEVRFILHTEMLWWFIIESFPLAHEQVQCTKKGINSLISMCKDNLCSSGRQGWISVSPAEVKNHRPLGFGWRQGKAWHGCTWHSLRRIPEWWDTEGQGCQGWLGPSGTNGETLIAYTKGTSVGSWVQFHTWWVCGVFNDSW